MKEQSPHHERSETLSLLKNKLSQWDVATIIFDLDGTLMDTHSTFLKGYADISTILVHGSIQTDPAVHQTPEVKKIRNLLRDISRGLSRQYHVAPEANMLVVQLAVKMLGIDPDSEQAQAAAKRMMAIYKDTPVVFDGAHDTVDAMHAAEKQVILATHGQEEWTWEKRWKTAFVGKFEKVICMPVDRAKSEGWKHMFDRLHIDPQKAMVIGDNLHADIEPTLKVGTRGVWITNGMDRIYSGEASTSTFESLPQERLLKVEAIKGVVPEIIKR